MLGAGTYDLSDDGIVMKTGVTLRGAGADKTLLVFTATNYCNNQKAASASPAPTNGRGDARASPAARTPPTGPAATRRARPDHARERRQRGDRRRAVHLSRSGQRHAASAPTSSCATTRTAPCSLEGGNGGRTINGVLRSQVQIVQGDRGQRRHVHDRPAAVFAQLAREPVAGGVVGVDAAPERGRRGSLRRRDQLGRA